MTAYSFTFRDRYLDDAYIQLQYVRNLIENQTWGFLDGRVSNTATSPLSVILTALFAAPFPSLIDGVAVMIALELSAICGLLMLMSRRLFGHLAFGIVATLGLATNPLLLSSFGLEGLLFALLMIASAYLFIRQRWVGLMVVLALLALTRAEGCLLFAICLLVMPLGWRTRAKLTAIYGAVQAPWYLFSWLVLGSFVPDTLLIKTAGITRQAWEGQTFWSGLELYWQEAALAVALSFALLPFGLVLLRRGSSRVRRIALILFGYGLAHYLAYSILAVPPFHWYYLSEAVAAVLVGALGVASLADGHPSPRRHLQRALVGALALAPVAGLAALGAVQGFPFREPPIHSNWATPARYREIGLWIRENLPPSATVRLEGELGTLAFYSELDMVNELSDRNQATDLMSDSDLFEVPGLGDLLRFGLRHREEQDPLPAADYVLRGVPSDDRAALADPDLVRAWKTSTRWVPSGHLYLLRAS